MERQPVQSGNLRSVRYDEAKKNLEIGFHSGIIHQEQNVPSKISMNLIDASSLGIFTTGKIKTVSDLSVSTGRS